MTRTSPVEVIVPLDTPDAKQAKTLIETLGSAHDHYKVGLQLFTAAGPDLVRALVDAGKRVFLDLKYHDIPNTVHGAVRSARGLGITMATVHASGGEDMLRAAVEAAEDAITLLGVTVLTSMDAKALARSWGRASAEPEVEVVRLARLALDSGIGGMVASPREVRPLRDALGWEPRLVTPGIRPAGAELGDQRRVATPAEATAAGADYLVIGRPITRSADPVRSLERIKQEIREAGAERTADAHRDAPTQWQAPV